MNRMTKPSLATRFPVITHVLMATSQRGGGDTGSGKTSGSGDDVIVSPGAVLPGTLREVRGVACGDRGAVSPS